METLPITPRVYITAKGLAYRYKQGFKRILGAYCGASMEAGKRITDYIYWQTL